jgi:hypothetical protein
MAHGSFVGVAAATGNGSPCPLKARAGCKNCRRWREKRDWQTRNFRSHRNCRRPTPSSLPGKATGLLRRATILSPRPMRIKQRPSQTHGLQPGHFFPGARADRRAWATGSSGCPYGRCYIPGAYSSNSKRAAGGRAGAVVLSGATIAGWKMAKFPNLSSGPADIMNGSIDEK